MTRGNNRNHFQLQLSNRIYSFPIVTGLPYQQREEKHLPRDVIKEFLASIVIPDLFPNGDLIPENYRATTTASRQIEDRE